ncbi:MAG: LysR substrate-binding domain-containing protein [Pseudomonadota bacterium]
MKLQQLKYLLAIVDNGLNITAAAERLYTSQPGVSKQLKLLEEELGLQLFTRKGKSLGSITPAGEQVIERARLIMAEAENIRSLAADYYLEEQGTLSIATTHTQARYVLPSVIGQFRDRYPSVNFDVHQGNTEQIADMAKNAEVDIVIATGSRDLFRDMLLVPAYTWHRRILVPRNHELANFKGEMTLEKLAEFPLVTYVFSFGSRSMLRKAFADRGLEADVVFTARDADVIKTYVRMGLGVGIVAAMAQDDDDGKDLVSIDVPDIFPPSTTWIGFQKGLALRRYMLEFIQLFAPATTADQLEQLRHARLQTDVDKLFAETAISAFGDNSDSDGSKLRSIA